MARPRKKEYLVSAYVDERMRRGMDEVCERTGATVSGWLRMVMRRALVAEGIDVGPEVRGDGMRATRRRWARYGEDEGPRVVMAGDPDAAEGDWHGRPESPEESAEPEDEEEVLTGFKVDDDGNVVRVRDPFGP